MSGDAETLASYNRSSELRSIANSIEPAFPSAADYLRGIAREIAARDAAIRAEALREAADEWFGAAMVEAAVVGNWLRRRAAQPTEGES